MVYLVLPPRIKKRSYSVTFYSSEIVASYTTSHTKPPVNKIWVESWERKSMSKYKEMSCNIRCVFSSSIFAPKKIPNPKEMLNYLYEQNIPYRLGYQAKICNAHICISISTNTTGGNYSKIDTFVKMRMTKMYLAGEITNTVSKRSLSKFINLRHHWMFNK